MENLELTFNFILKILILFSEVGSKLKNAHSHHFYRGLSHCKKQRIEIMAQRQERKKSIYLQMAWCLHIKSSGVYDVITTTNQ